MSWFRVRQTRGARLSCDERHTPGFRYPENRRRVEEFSPLSASIMKLQERCRGVTRHIVYENQEGLSVVYNRFLNARDSKNLIVFVHDDVRIQDLFFVEKLDQAFDSFDVIGVAGNQRPSREHLS